MQLIKLITFRLLSQSKLETKIAQKQDQLSKQSVIGSNPNSVVPDFGTKLVKCDRNIFVYIWIVVFGEKFPEV